MKFLYIIFYILLSTHLTFSPAKMNIAESAAAFVLGDPQEAYYAQHQDSRINIHAPEWVPASVSYQNPLDFQIAEAKRNLTHAFACARHAQKIAEDATIAAKIATDSAFSASESVEKAASILRDLQRMYDYPVLPVQRTSVSAVNTGPSPVPSATVRAISAAIRAMPVTARVTARIARPIPIVAPPTIPATVSQKVQRGGNMPPSTSPIVAPVKLRRGTNDCFNKQQSLPCKPYNGKACRYCK